MNEVWKKIKNILLILAVSVCLCSFVIKAVNNANQSELTLSFWGTNLPYQYSLEHIAKEYNKLGKGQIKIAKKDAGTYRTWMGTRLAGDNAPEILATNNIYANVDAENNYLVDLTPYLNEPNPYNNSNRPWKDDFSGTYLQQLAFAGDNSKFYCIPTETVSVRFVINTDILDNLGIPVPDINWTFSEFRHLSEKLEQNGYVALEIANAKYINYMVSWLIDIFMSQLKYEDILTYDLNRNNQVETEEIVAAFLDEDDPINLEKDKDFKEVLTFLKTWSAHWGLGFNSNDETSEEFLRQNVPMMFCGSWGVSGIELTLNNENPEADKTNPYKKFHYKSLPVPRLEKNVYIDEETPSFTFSNFQSGLPLQELGEPSGCFCIPKTVVEDGKLDEAIDFLHYFTSVDTMNYLANSCYSIPVVKGITTSDLMKDFLPIEGSETVRMRFNLYNLGDGVAEEYHFKQVQLFLSDDSSAISLNTLCKNVQKKYIEVCQQLADDNGW